MNASLDSIGLADVADCHDGDVILGGGVCGCLLAHELLAKTDRPVWIIEAGGRQDENVLDRSRPARWLSLLGSTDDDAHTTMPNAALAGRAIRWPRGRGLGGSGRINAMIWVPPDAEDWRGLARAGLEPECMSTAWQRANELMAVESPRYLSPTAQKFLSAVEGHPELGVFSAFQRINRRGQRWTTQQLLIDALGVRPNLASRLHCIRATAQYVKIRGDRIGAVVLEDGTGVREIALEGKARVISCLGALATPRMLTLSGIGDPEVLSRIGVTPRVKLSSVGKNLHDHLIMPVVYDREPPSFLPGPPTKEQIDQWNQNGTGPLASNVAECGGFNPGSQFQLHVTPTDYLRYPDVKAACAMTLGVHLTRPRSRGWMEPVRDAGEVRLSIHSDYMNEPADGAGLLRGVRWVRDIAGELRKAGVMGAERVPGSRRSEDAGLLAAIARYSQTLYHPGGTCAIGRDGDQHSVVTSDFEVRGVLGLSIVDASLLPEPTTGNPTALLAMLTCYAGERLSTSNIA